MWDKLSVVNTVANIAKTSRVDILQFLDIFQMKWNKHINFINWNQKIPYQFKEQSFVKKLLRIKKITNGAIGTRGSNILTIFWTILNSFKLYWNLMNPFGPFWALMYKVFPKNISGYKHARRLRLLHLKGGIGSSVWSTKTFLCNIREPRYREIKIGYHLLKF